MNNFRKTTWEDAIGQDVWIKLADGTMEKHLYRHLEEGDDPS